MSNNDGSMIRFKNLAKRNRLKKVKYISYLSNISYTKKSIVLFHNESNDL